MDNIYLRNDEKAIFSLRSLYQKYGYRQYKMSKFEEYDLYVRNKNFLVSDNIITFTDTDGKLMALKPDVTLSIIKNTEDTNDSLKKVYYNENVYRVSKGTQSFKEIMQVGLECVGNVDDYTIYEVLKLAVMSLSDISEDYILDISHLGIVSEIIDNIDASDEVKRKLLNYVGEKNIPELSALAKKENIDCEMLKEMVLTYGTVEEVMPFLEKVKCGETEKIIKILKELENDGFKGKIHLDFSMISDMKYYNGFVFKGFIKGIPTSVLSGGQYDNLMMKMKKKEKAIGFAVYLDMLERLSEEESEYDVDVVILYDDKSDISAVSDAVSLLSANGNSVMAQTKVPEKLRYKQLVKLQERGVQIVENNA